MPSARGLHRGGRILDRGGVAGPGRLLHRRDAELGLQRLEPRRIELRRARAAVHRAGTHSPAHVPHHARTHAAGAVALHERGPKAAGADTA
jgi:hypothetical protein